MSHDVDPALLAAELRARAEHARHPYDTAVWRLVGGDPTAGLDAIRRGLPALKATTTAQPSTGFDAARLALVADDPAAPSLATAAIDDALARFIAGDRQYHAAMLAIIAGDDTRAAAFQADLDAFTASHDAFRSGQPSGVADISRGLLARDAAMTNAGVSTLLAWHLRRVRARSDFFNSSRGVISLDAIVALILAHRRGLAISVGPEYRSAKMPLLVLHIADWDGRPLPRAKPIQLVTDLVAGPWLRTHGIAIEDPPPFSPSKAQGATRTARAPTASTPEQQEAARQALAARVRGPGSPWQLAGWSLMLGDVSGAREHLARKAAEVRQQWQASAPSGGGLSRLFSKDRALPNPNYVRSHFGFALALGDEAGLRESGAALQAWLRTQEGRGWGIYAHTVGYLDLVCDLVAGGDRSRPPRTEVEQVIGLLPSTRVAAIALVDRDPALFRTGLEEMLSQHATSLERKTAPPPPICEPAVHLAAAARRLGVPVQVDERFAAWPVPVEGARLPCDLLGRAIWSGVG